MGDNNQYYLDIVRPHLTEHRYTHTIGVLETARLLGDRFGGDRQVLETSAILHDIAKFWPATQMVEDIRKHQLDEDLLHYDKELWHAPVGAEHVKYTVGIADDRIIDCIRYHTVGRPNMALEEKIIWLADYIEPGRHFPGIDDVRSLAEKDLDAALLSGFDRTIMFLLKQGKKVYPATFLTRNWLVDIIKSS